MKNIFISTLFLGLFLTCTACAKEIVGVVSKVADGDTLTLNANGKKYKIRLAEIDTAERDQPYGSEAKTVLSNLVLNKQVRVLVIKKSDRYGRVIGRIFLGEDDVNAYMVEMGHAMVYRRYLTDQSLLELENNAKENQRGLWKLPQKDRVPPWVWRKLKRKKS
jgi:endonuclease YncB( thermonuclease family)